MYLFVSLTYLVGTLVMITGHSFLNIKLTPSYPTFFYYYFFPFLFPLSSLFFPLSLHDTVSLQFSLTSNSLLHRWVPTTVLRLLALYPRSLIQPELYFLPISVSILPAKTDVLQREGQEEGLVIPPERGGTVDEIGTTKVLPVMGHRCEICVSHRKLLTASSKSDNDFKR